MTLADAIDRVIEQTGHARYRELCSAANPDATEREGYRRLVLDLASGIEPRGTVHPAVQLATPREPITFPPTGGCCG